MTSTETTPVKATNKVVGQKKTVKRQNGEPTATVTIEAPNLLVAKFLVLGTSPYVQHAFSEKAQKLMEATQEQGPTAKKGRKREPKDFTAMYEGSRHESTDGWFGIPCNGLRAALVSACKLCGFAMTRAKLAVFVDEDGWDKHEGTGLIRITKGEPREVRHPVRIAMGTTDIHARAMWDPGWEAMITITYDGDVFTLTDIANLLSRVGQQVGIGEGRHDSKSSTGMGWGKFRVAKTP